jgi:chromosome segregation ATPase
MLRPHFSPLFNAADETPAGGGGQDAKLTFSQRLSALVKGKETLTAEIGTHKATIATHEAAIAGHVTTIEARDATIAELQTKITTLEAENAEFRAAIEASEKEVTTLQSQEQDIDKRAEGKSKEKLAALGFPSTALPGTTEKIAAESGSAALLAKFQAEQDPDAKATLYQEYKAALAAETKVKA